MAFQRAKDRTDPTAHHWGIASSLFSSSSSLLQIDIIISQSFLDHFPSFRTLFISTLRALSDCSIRSRLRRRILALDPGLSSMVLLCHQDISLSILCGFSLSRSRFRLSFIGPSCCHFTLAIFSLLCSLSPTSLSLSLSILHFVSFILPLSSPITFTHWESGGWI